MSRKDRDPVRLIIFDRGSHELRQRREIDGHLSDHPWVELNSREHLSIRIESDLFGVATLTFDGVFLLKEAIVKAGYAVQIEEWDGGSPLAVRSFPEWVLPQVSGKRNQIRLSFDPGGNEVIELVVDIVNRD